MELFGRRWQGSGDSNVRAYSDCAFLVLDKTFTVDDLIGFDWFYINYEYYENEHCCVCCLFLPSGLLCCCATRANSDRCCHWRNVRLRNEFLWRSPSDFWCLRKKTRDWEVRFWVSSVRLVRRTGLLHSSMLRAILPPYSLSRMKVIVFGYKENNNYHSRALHYLKRIVLLPLQQSVSKNLRVSSLWIVVVHTAVICYLWAWLSQLFVHLLCLRLLLWQNPCFGPFRLAIWLKSDLVFQSNYWFDYWDVLPLVTITATSRAAFPPLQ